MLEDLIDSYDFRGFAVKCTLFYSESYSLDSVFISFSSHTYHSMCNLVSRKSVFYTVLRPDSPKIRSLCVYRYRHVHCYDDGRGDVRFEHASSCKATCLHCVRLHLEAVPISTHIHVFRAMTAGILKMLLPAWHVPELKKWIKIPDGAC